jgi:hypothetical protein
VCPSISQTPTHETQVGWHAGLGLFLVVSLDLLRSSLSDTMCELQSIEFFLVVSAKTSCLYVYDLAMTGRDRRRRRIHTTSFCCSLLQQIWFYYSSCFCSIKTKLALCRGDITRLDPKCTPSPASPSPSAPLAMLQGVLALLSH